MKVALINAVTVNGTISLLLTAENAEEQAKVNEVRSMIRPVYPEARGLDITGTGEELLIIPLEQVQNDPEQVPGRGTHLPHLRGGSAVVQ